MNFHHLLGPEAVRVNKCCWLVLWFARGPPRTRRNLQAVLSLGIRNLSFRNCEISIGVGLVGGCRWLFFFGGGVRREGGWQFLSCWIIFNLWVKKILRLCGLIVVFCFFCFLLCGTHGFFILPSMRTKKHVYGMELPYADLLCQRVATWLPESVGVRCTRYHF